MTTGHSFYTKRRAALALFRSVPATVAGVRRAILSPTLRMTYPAIHQGDHERLILLGNGLCVRATTAGWVCEPAPLWRKICETCQTVFSARLKKRRFCGHRCAGRGMAHIARETMRMTGRQNGPKHTRGYLSNLKAQWPEIPPEAEKLWRQDRNRAYASGARTAARAHYAKGWADALGEGTRTRPAPPETP